MGRLSLLLRDPVFMDANALIYSVERVAPYADALEALWQHIRTQKLVVRASELVVLETLIGPMKAGDQALEARFRRFLFASPELALLPITRDTLDRAARLRASHPALKTPDAIHAATALEAGAMTFITNDAQFRQVPGLTVVTPHELA